ncbi:RagB/SusD family nutrient uptake outer membrane protein [Olivibacter sp. CPCC 100613]|uniref:RagB/SusD family nutrient uptake outer membrane protein n=1 Tax=Olivibacter sp. CPCC 100613 TaxID=3079931 RepID=UPI002FFB10FC
MRTRVIIGVIVLLTSIFSCKKWVETKSDESTYVVDVLTDREGFSRALAGIYYKMGSATLYGRELEFGMLDVMVGYWKINKQHEYYPDYNFDYHSLSSERRIAGIWSGLYRAIHDCNVILDQVDKIKSDPYYDLIKGEALGLRAFLHLELLKLFGPIIKQEGLDTRAIPYYSSSSREVQEFLSSRACFALMEQDLQAAKILLKADPIITRGREADGNHVGDRYNSLIDRRGIHLNYYAVLALLARKAQWEGNMGEAAVRARFLLDQLGDTQAVRFIAPSEAIGGNIRFTKENIFGLYINDMDEVTEDYFPSGDIAPNRALPLDFNSFLIYLYAKDTGTSTDLRVSAWGMFSVFLQKFMAPTMTASGYDPDLYEAQIINLPEIYFILVEAFLDRDLEKGLNYLNTVRRARQLPELKFSDKWTKEKLAENLLDEVRREYLGEGYLFTYYKHLNHTIYRSTGSIDPDRKIFMLPIPVEEQQLNQGYGIKK